MKEESHVKIFEEFKFRVIATGYLSKEIAEGQRPVPFWALVKWPEEIDNSQNYEIK